MKTRCLLALFGLLLPGLAVAWSAQGHRIVGELAERQVRPETRAEIQRLLRGVEEPTLAGVANWADEVRPLPEWRHTARWHYVNFPDLSCNYAPARDCPDGNCVIGAINAQKRMLADRSASTQQRSQALKFLVHFVGDVHQPMHAGLAADRGGNDFQLRHQRQGMNLHSVWDNLILRSREPDWRRYVELLGGSATPVEDPAQGSDNPARDWAIESCRIIGEHAIYPSRPGRPIGSSYLDRHRPVAEKRLRQAGARLARLLDEALAHGH